METLDIILLVCFVPALVTGIRKGLVEQLVSLVSIFVGVWAAFKLSVVVGDWLNGFIHADQKIVNIAAFAITVIITIFLLAAVGKIITKTLSLASLGWLNRLLGFVFALLKAAIVIGLLIFILDPVITKYGIIKAEVLNSYVVYTSLHDLSLKVFPYLKELIVNG